MATTKDIQKRLTELGLYAGKIDGITGKQTRAAIRAFQRLNSLDQDGKVGPKTHAALWPAIMPIREQEPAKAVGPEGSIWPRQRDVAAFFGAVGQNQTMLTLPWPMKIAWDKRKPVTKFSIHEKCHDSALRCFNRIGDAYDEKARELTGIDLFGGCLNVRKMRGGTSWSMHAWGIAIDFDPARNQLRWGRDRARLAMPDCEAFWRIWEEEGWVSLGRTRDMDHMHVQAARLW